MEVPDIAEGGFCANCGESIETVDDEVYCDTCNETLHEGCKDFHESECEVDPEAD